MALKDEEYRKQKQADIKAKADATATEKQQKADSRAKAVYDQSVKKYENELRLDPKDENPVGYKLRKFGDSVGDTARSVGKFFGTNRMTSLDDEAQMQARKDVKGYKKGGKVSSASKRADGCCTKGKTKGRMI